MIVQGVTVRGSTIIDHPNPITSGLQQYFDIGNPTCYSGTGTTLVDLSGSGLGNGALTGGTTYTAAGLGSYITFNGSTTYAQTPNLITMAQATLNVTLEVWIRTSTDNGVIVSEQGNTPFDSGWHDSQMEIVSGNYEAAVWPYTLGGGIVVGAVTRNVWQQYTLTYNQSTNVLTGYINGVTQNSSPWVRQFSGSVLYYTIARGDFTNLGDGSFLNCNWSIFKVYNRALTPAEILQNYQAVSWRYRI